MALSIATATVYALVGLATYGVGLTLYRLFFHPLAKYPGPKLAAASRWPEFYHEVIKKGQFSKVIEQYHDQYGPIVRIVPNELHIRDSQFYEQFYTKNGRGDKMREESARFGNETSTFATPEASLHTIRRGALNAFFSRQRIIDLESVIRAKLNILIANLREDEMAGEVINLRDVSAAFVGDVITQYCFSFDYDHLNSDKFGTNWHMSFQAVTQIGPLAMQFPFLPKLMNSLPPALVEKLDPLYGHLFRLQEDLANEIKKLKVPYNNASCVEKRPSVLRSVLENSDLPPQEKNTQRMIDESQLLIAAGLLTTAWALSVGAYHIVASPKIFKTLRAELDEAISDPTVPDAFKWTELEKLPYLSGCVKESIRLSQPATHRSQRLYNEPIQYKEWLIPSRTPIGMNQTDVNTDPKIFPEPYAFKPERWIDSPPTAYGPTIDKFFVSFGKGTRSCLGVNLAWCELYLAMAGVFRNFTFELYETDTSDVEIAHDFLAAFSQARFPRCASENCIVKAASSWEGKDYQNGCMATRFDGPIPTMSVDGRKNRFSSNGTFKSCSDRSSVSLVIVLDA